MTIFCLIFDYSGPKSAFFWSMQKPEHTISPPIGSVPIGGEMFISRNVFRMRFLSFDGAGGDAFDDIAREEDVHEQHRQDGEQDEHIDLAEVKF